MSATTIKQRQIEDGAINNNKVAAGAGIDSSKLADGANFLKKDGSVAMTGSLDLGNQKAVNMQTPSNPNDGANKSYVDAQISALNSIFKPKPNARVRATGNVTISNPGTAVFDTITLATSEYIMLGLQSAPAENGLYMFNGSSSAMTRITQMDAWVEVPGATVVVEEGATSADTMWLCTANTGGTLGVTAITWQQIPTTSGLLNSNFVDKEVPSGAINGSNVTYTLANTPVAGSDHVYVNGMLQEVGAGNDYTISGGTITMLTALATGEKIRVSYRK